MGILINMLKETTNINSLVEMKTIMPMFTSKIKFVSVTKNAGIMVKSQSLLGCELSSDGLSVLLDGDMGERHSLVGPVILVLDVGDWADTGEEILFDIHYPFQFRVGVDVSLGSLLVVALGEDDGTVTSIYPVEQHGESGASDKEILFVAPPFHFPTLVLVPLRETIEGQEVSDDHDPVNRMIL